MKKIAIMVFMVLGVFLFVEKVNATELNLELINILAESGPEAPDLELDHSDMSCKELLGPGLTALVKLFITGVRIVAVIIATVIAMMNFIPPIMNGNPDGELQKALKKTSKLLVVLVIVVGFPSILNLIGNSNSQVL